MTMTRAEATGAGESDEEAAAARDPVRLPRLLSKEVLAAVMGGVFAVVVALVTGLLTAPDAGDPGTENRPIAPQPFVSPSPSAGPRGRVVPGTGTTSESPTGPNPVSGVRRTTRTGPAKPTSTPTPTPTRGTASGPGPGVTAAWPAEYLLAELTAQATNATRGECQTGGGAILEHSVLLTPPAAGGYARWDLTVPAESRYTKLTFRAGVRDARDHNPDARVRIFVQIGDTAADGGTDKRFEEVRTYGQVIDPTTIGVIPGQRVRIQASAGESAAETLCFQQPVLSR
jgi:hypothetical protein